MKYVILVGDGMGDRPLPELDGRTPLEAAATPAMDRLAREGEQHLLRTIPEGFPPGSDVANLSLAGYRPGECYTGRAPLEAASLGVELGPGEIAFRCNLVTLDRRADGTVVMVDYSAGHIGSDEARELIVALDKAAGNEAVRLYPGVGYRHLLVHRGELQGLDTVPPHDHTGQPVTEFWQRYQNYPHLQGLIDTACEILADHPVNRARKQRGERPANGVWLWGEGRAPSMATLTEQFGISGALISAVDLLKGIGVYAGMEIINVPGATGYLDTNYAGKAAAALEALDRHDLVFVHVEAPDEAAHQGELDKKLQAIEDFDAKIVAPIVQGLEKMGEPFRVVVAMDHFTPLAIRTHSSEPVPIVLFDSAGGFKASDRPYSEANGEAAGSLLADGPALYARLLHRSAA